jgi:hypothetical protein
VSAERIPRGTPPNLARRGEIATKTQKPRPICNCECTAELGAPAGPLRRFPGVCDGGVERTDHYDAGDRREKWEHPTTRPGRFWGGARR